MASARFIRFLFADAGEEEIVLLTHCEVSDDIETVLKFCLINTTKRARVDLNMIVC